MQNQAPNYNFDVQLLTWKTFDLVHGVGDDLKDKLLITLSPTLR